MPVASIDRAMPAWLRRGDAVAIVSPASAVRGEYIDGSVRAITARGYRPVVMPHARGTRGSYSATAEERLSDMIQALHNPDIRAILCSRGGYGCVELVDKIPVELVAATRKWLIGFSDISALHALWQHAGVASLHASMARQLTEQPDPQAPANCRLWGILEGADPLITFQRTYTPGADSTPMPSNRPGTARGPLVGGNMAVFMGLTGTPYFPVHPGDILLIEDVGEEIYRVERMLHQLRLAGILPRLAALLVGRFTSFRSPTADWPSMEAMIAHMVQPYTFPVAYDLPCGHIGPDNLPLLLTPQHHPITLTVTHYSTTLAYLPQEN